MFGPYHCLHGGGGPKAGAFPSFESPDVWSHPIPCRLCLKPASSHGSSSLSRDPLLNISDNNQHSWHCFPNSCLGARPSAGTWSAFPADAVSALPNKSFQPATSASHGLQGTPKSWEKEATEEAKKISLDDYIEERTWVWFLTQKTEVKKIRGFLSFGRNHSAREILWAQNKRMPLTACSLTLSFISSIYTSRKWTTEAIQLGLPWWRSG